jgi:hypothetical protein
MKMTTKKTLKELERSESIERLRTLFAGNDKPLVYTIQRHVSSSGMTRDISLFYASATGLTNITYSAAMALEWPLSEKSGHRAIRVGGTGMDMGFHLVYTLSNVVYRGDVEGDAGYTLEQEWL